VESRRTCQSRERGIHFGLDGCALGWLEVPHRCDLVRDGQEYKAKKKAPTHGRGFRRFIDKLLAHHERRYYGEGQSDQNPGERLHTAVGDGTNIPRAEHAYEELMLSLLTLGFPGFDGEFDGNQYDFEYGKGDHESPVHC
jgi:hypothetical protein